mgnify:CR=1 FL=1
MERKRVNASWFISFGYCEYKFYLEQVKGYGVIPTKAMILGKIIHAEKEKEFLKKSYETTWAEFLASEERTITKELLLSKQIGDIILTGKIDEIAIDRDAIHIIDDKPGKKFYDSARAQLFAYCYLFKETFEQEKPILAFIRNRDTHEIVWQQQFNKESEESFLLTFHRLRKVLLEEEDPIPTTNPKKCLSCSFNQQCQFSLVKND